VHLVGFIIKKAVIMHSHMDVKICQLLSVLHFGSPFPAVIENVEIKTNAAVRIRNFQGPQHPVE
jgi:hypothetical protein